MATNFIDASHKVTVTFGGKTVQRVDDVEHGHFAVKFRKADGTEQIIKGQFRFLNSIRQLFAARKAEIAWLFAWYATEFDSYRWRYTKHGGWTRCRYSGINLLYK